MKDKKWWRDFGVGQIVLDTLSNNQGKQFILFDTETTGLSPVESVNKWGRTVEASVIIQISAIKCEIDEDCQFHEVDKMDLYINPEKKLPTKITEITGITDELLSQYPNENAQWSKIYEFFGDNAIVCGHNSRFDIGFMQELYKRHGKEFHVDVELDTLKMAQELHLKEEAGSHKLGDLTRQFGLDYGLTFHNSMDDVTATMRLLRLFVEEYQDKKLKGNPSIDVPVGIVSVNGKIPTKIKSAWAWTGYKGMQRLYVRVWYEDRIVWMNQRRPYNWGEKTPGSIDMFDMHDIERQVLKLYQCETLEELSKVRESRYAR